LLPSAQSVLALLLTRCVYLPLETLRRLNNSPIFHSQAVLGIEAFPSDARDNPQAPLLSAGTRRQSACSTLLQQAHTLGFEHGLMDEPTIDNLAGLLALMQMITFSELQPKKSRALLRAAVGHYKELQDAAKSREDADEVQRLFGLGLYVRSSLLRLGSPR